ncbi:hypothetical protein [Achromobacter phage Motura]|uniref:Uncharacterized protein n=1 Tax=Achromobacter phage Motura TaxID=2591403 RepID=A0A514CT90_9CAUD|nr:hypothetical protein H1O15_gp129 [Achromobacter phage Motura]QDH83682.1 hypothetical protein [Achromobacter phage Motura]
MTTYATYDKDGYFSGAVEADEQPANSSPFMPLESPPGYRAWFDGVGWVQQPILNGKGADLQVAKRTALGLLARAVFRDAESDEYPVAERESFDAQYAEALAVIRGDDIGTYITAIADATGRDPQALAKSIVQKHEASRERHAVFVAQLQALRRQIVNAKSPAQMPAYAELQKVGVR